MVAFGKIRANILIVTRQWLTEQFPPEAFQSFLNKIPDYDRRYWEDQRLSANQMIPSSIYKSLFDEGVPIFGDNNPEFFRQGAANTASVEIEKSMHAFVRYGLPSFIGRQMGMVWRHYFTLGNLNVETYTENSMEFSLEYAEEYGRGSCCGAEGWIRKALGIAGAKSIEFHQSKCVFRGDSKCLIHFTWKFFD